VAAVVLLGAVLAARPALAAAADPPIATARHASRARRTGRSTI
jgi:hypothetical protein